MTERFAGTDRVFERTVEELLAVFRAEQRQAVAAKPNAELVGRRARDLVAVIAVNAVRGDALREPVVVGPARRIQRRRMTGRADAEAERMFARQVPAGRGL